MSRTVWTFQRDGKELSLARKAGEAFSLTIITEGDSSRRYGFADLAALIRFQADMETLLLRTGWTFARFSPESRRGRDRRTFPRIHDRRRWWTDGSKSTDSCKSMLKVVWGG